MPDEAMRRDWCRLKSTDWAPKSGRILGAIAVIAVVATVKGIRHLPPKAIAGLHLGLPIRWYLLSRRRGVAYEAVADAEIQWFTTRLTEFLLSLPREVLLLLTAAFIARQVWRVLHPPTPEVDRA